MPFLTIQKGINTVTTGGTVHVADGTYNENVVVNKYSNLIGGGTLPVTPSSVVPAAGWLIYHGQPSTALTQ